MTVQPDYDGHGIANLMASIGAAHAAAGPLPVLQALGPEEISAHRTTVLLVVDALGHDYLVRHGAGALAHHLRAPITSVFPSTTAAAIPTFLTGLPPAAHGLTGWHVYLRELGSVLAVLPGRPRYGGVPYGQAGLSVRELFGNVPVFDRLQADCHVVAPRSIANSDFNRAHVGRARLHSFGTLEELFDTLARIASAAGTRSYIYAYWPELDRIGHEEGISSHAAHRHLAAIEAAFGQFLERIAGSDTLVLVSADHGMIDVAEVINLDSIPGIRGDLALPLCGEPRAAYCYVRAGREQSFLQRINAACGDALALHRSADLLARGWFGPAPHNPRLAERIGDYTLLPGPGSIVTDRVFGEQSHRLIGTHGGLSAAEMTVPLVVARA